MWNIVFGIGSVKLYQGDDESQKEKEACDGVHV